MTNNLIHAKAVFIIIALYYVYSSNGFCYNTYSKTMFTPDRKLTDKSYFGYSTLLREGTNPTIFVGAPRDMSEYYNHRNIRNPGAIYSCPISLKDNNIKCKQKIVDTTGNSRITARNGKSYIHKKDNMWLGMSITGTTNNNGTLVMCAPRWMNQIHSTFYLGNGMCYALKDTNSNYNTDTHTLLPLVDQDNQSYKPSSLAAITTYGENVYYYAFGQAGISSQLSEDNTELLIGAPGVYIWTGSVIRYTINKYDSYTQKTIPNPFYTVDIEDGSYFGYSVGIGKFVSDRNDLYAAGAPRGANYKGAVYIFKFPDSTRQPIDILVKLEGNQIGEYFGSTIATVDINQDGLTDLIIGAPSYAEPSSWDLGRVYVYINKDKGIFKEQDVAIYGSYRDGARFGTSISDIGDINGDGYTDVAIGAPYENYNKGAVYIYLGTAEGLNPVYVQRITSDKTEGFGISISKGVDIDNNQCKDIAIGAYLSGHVVLLRCHPSVTAIPTIQTVPQELSLEDSNFTASICLEFKGSEKYSTELDVNVVVDVDYKRVSFNNINDALFQVEGSGNEKSCKDILFQMKTENMDYSLPIEIKMSYKLKHDPMKDYTFCSSCTVLHPSSSQELSIRVPIASGCGSDSICQPDLKLHVEQLTESPFIIGSGPSIKLNISLENLGEPAYLAQLQIPQLSKAPLLRIPPRCRMEESILFCDFDNPFLSGSVESMVIEFSTSLLLNSDTTLTFNISTTSGGIEISPDDNLKILDIQLKSEAVLDIRSHVAPTQFNYVEFRKDVKQNISIVHSFEIENSGPSPLDLVVLRFFLPMSFSEQTLLSIYKPKATINSQLMACNLISGTYQESENQFKTIDIDDKNDNSTETDFITPSSILLSDDDDDDKVPKIDKGTVDALISYLPKENDEGLPRKNRRINCTDKDNVSCLIVECKGSLLATRSNGAQIQFNIEVNTTTIKTLLKDNHAIMLTSYGMVESPYNRGDERIFNFASSYVIGSTPSANTPIWLIILSILLGLLALALLIYAMYKYGFFERTTKDKLELLKNQELKNDSDDQLDIR